MAECTERVVASRVVCKLRQGATLPIMVQMAEDSIDDPFTTGVLVEAGHGTGSPTNFTEAARLRRVGRAHHAPVLFGAVKEAEQAVEIALALRVSCADMLFLGRRRTAADSQE